MPNSKLIPIAKEIYPMQKIAKVIGESGCYFLCLCYVVQCITGVPVDPIYYYNRFTKEKHGDKALMDLDCYLNFPAIVLTEMLKAEIAKYGINFKFSSINIRKETNIKYVPKNNEALIGYFEIEGNHYGHFVNIDEAKKVINDPLEKSNTVKNGKLKSLRIIEIC